MLCFAMAGVLRAEDQAQTILAKSHFTGGVAVHVHGADASLLRSLAQQCPNLLGHLLVAQEKDARRPAKRWWPPDCTARSPSASGNRGRCRSSTTSSTC